MLNWLRARSRSGAKAKELYGAVVAAARSPSYYLDFGVPDTPEGRFEMVALQLFLRLERVKGIPPDGEDIAQATIEAFVTDMDDSLRELGVGDLTVPKKVKRAAAAFYERAKDYREGLRLGQHELASSFNAHIFAGHNGAAALLLARHARALHDTLARTPDAAIFKDMRLVPAIEPDSQGKTTHGKP